MVGSSQWEDHFKHAGKVTDTLQAFSVCSRYSDEAPVATLASQIQRLTASSTDFEKDGEYNVCNKFSCRYI